MSDNIFVQRNKMHINDRRFITIKQINIIDQYRVLNTSKKILLFVKRVGIPLLQFQAALRGTFSPDDNVVSDDEE